MNEQITLAGKEIGSEYNFDKVIVANTFKAHKLLHLAKKENKQNELEEKLFKAYFTDGKNVDDISTLIEIAKEAGLNTNNLFEILESEKYNDEVRLDIYEAHQLEIRSVPFFVFNRKYGVRGTQEPNVFLQTLEKSFNEWKSNK